MSIYDKSTHACTEHDHNCGCGSHSTTTSNPNQLSMDINIDMSSTTSSIQVSDKWTEYLNTMPWYPGTCSHCGVEFESVDEYATFCSKECEVASSGNENPHTDDVHDCGCDHLHEHSTTECSIASLRAAPPSRKTKPIYTNICKQCGVAFETPNKRKKLCSDECRNERDKGKVMHDSTCTVCEVRFKSYTADKQYCSSRCYTVRRRQEEVKLFGDREGIDYIVCPICNTRMRQISHAHAKMHGFSSPSAMKESLGIETTCQSTRDNLTGENNPAYNHGGKYSPWSKNFIKGYDQERHLAHNKKLSDLMNDPEYRKNFPFLLEYWLVVTNGNEEEAKLLYTKSQTRDLDWFIEKHGPEYGPIRHRHKIEEWMKNFKKVNYSMVSQVLFDEIMDRLPDECKTQVFYATHNLSPDAVPGTNNEYRLSTVKSFVRPDFIMLDKKKVIEFDGTYWHSPERYDPEKEERRDADIQEMGYDILHIAEYDFKHYRDGVIQKCVDFIMKTL